MKEIYWRIVSDAEAIAILGGTSYLFCWLIKPFLREKKRFFLVGVVHFAVMLPLYFRLFEMDSMEAHATGVLAGFVTMYAIDRRNWEQKIFLSFTLYLLDWISHGFSILLRDAVIALFEFIPFERRQEIEFGLFVIQEIVYIFLRFFILKLLVYMVRRSYSNKQEHMSKRELALMLSTPLSVITGYCAFEFFSDIYLIETEKYIWNVYREYWWIKVIYQLISFVAFLLMIITYQKIKSIHKKEKEEAVLQEQIGNMKGHIAEVETRYVEIRRLKHDMGNHVATLEHLVLKRETQEAENYLARLKGELQEIVGEGGSGNPVVDVILDESRRKAEERGICFISDFHYPGDASISAFDLSVILNNAINNAIEGCEGMEHPQIHLTSYRERNVYMIECRNRFIGEICLDEENGLPLTSKKDRQEHGYGLISIRKVAQKYHGDLDIRLENETFILSVMLMLDQ